MSKPANVLRAMTAFTAPAPAEPAQQDYKLDAAMFAWTLAFRRWLKDDTKPFPHIAPFVEGLTPEQAEALTNYALDAMVSDMPKPVQDAVTCHKCGAVVDGDALAVQTAADGTPKLGSWYCRAHLVAGTERLKAAIREQREGGE